MCGSSKYASHGRFFGLSPHSTPRKFQFSFILPLKKLAFETDHARWGDFDIKVTGVIVVPFRG